MDKKEFDKLVKQVEDGKADDKVLKKLEPYRAKRAVFLAAGFGSRLVPITINTPKPLVRVNGTRIIDTMLDACLAAGIEEIYIVRGYLREQFDTLLYKYPMIKFIDNLDYDKANNIGSAALSCELFENSYVLEADLLVSNPKIIRKYHYNSDVLGIWKDKSDDWCLVPDADGFVAEETVTGENCYQMVGVYYWNKEDAKKLEKDIKEVYAKPDGKDKYWETIPNQVYQGKYKVEIVPCKESDIVEIDTFDELKAIDKTYCN